MAPGSGESDVYLDLSRLSLRAASSAHRLGATWSSPPWHMSTGGGLAPGLTPDTFPNSSNRPPSSSSSSLPMYFPLRGRYPRRDSTPPSAGDHDVRSSAAASASPAPWLNPATRTLPGATPRCSIKPSTSRLVHATAPSMPPHVHGDPSRGVSVSSSHPPSRVCFILGSNHAVASTGRPAIWNLRFGAAGRTTSKPPGIPRTNSSVNSLQCAASSPKPWRNTSVPRGVAWVVSWTLHGAVKSGSSATSASIQEWSSSRHLDPLGRATTPVSMRRLTRRRTRSTSRWVTAAVHARHSSCAECIDRDVLAMMSATPRRIPFPWIPRSI